MVAGFLVSRGAKNVSLPWLSPLRDSLAWGIFTIAFTGKFVYIYIYIYILYLFIYVYTLPDFSTEF